MCASIYIPPSIRDWYLEVKVRAKDRQYSFCLLILETKVTRILKRLTWVYHVVHNTCTTHGRDIKTQCIGLTSILLLRKDWHSVRLDRMQSPFQEHLQLIVFQKLLDWKLEKSYPKKYTCHLDLHQRSHYVTNGQMNWVRKLFNKQKEELFNNQKGNCSTTRRRSWSTNQVFPINPTKLQIQFVIDQGDLITWNIEETRPVLKR